ncbi:MAG: 30S ribosomal protein S3 [Candidatus Euphemobacter frigidus]|nr:30S ribosomal protein S3 [Candidatus Euphemobacter frigidus]MDP8276198.1 30S ribosomal protein S3 [Candidatus Euphemobacter frigidus]
MGQKVNPISFRIGFNKKWSSQWYANKKDFGDFLLEDDKLRGYIKKKFYHTGISEIQIFRRTPEKVRIKIFTARPGLVVGRRGAAIDVLREELRELVNREVIIDISDVKVPELEAQLVSENVAQQLERRISFRRAVKRAIGDTMVRGAEGIKIQVAGRLGGREMCRTESYKKGKIPLQTLRADISYGFAEAFTNYGTIGVKTWIYRGEKLSAEEEDVNHGSDAKKS